MSCPDAVRAELLKLAGMLDVKYYPGLDFFTLRYESALAGLDAIQAAAAAAGKLMGREYVVEVIG